MTRLDDAQDRAIAVLRWAIIAAVAAGFIRLGGPYVEGRVWPIIIYAKREALHRDGQRLCWATTMKKGREGFPERAEYFVNYDFDVPAIGPSPARRAHVRSSIPVSLASNGVPLNVPGFAYHPPHVRWLTSYCTTLPDNIEGKAFTIDGTLYYRGANPLWLVPQPLPTIDVPADG